jgi:hypothetical protein
MKILLNNSHIWMAFSDNFHKWMLSNFHLTGDSWRHHPKLISKIEELGIDNIRKNKYNRFEIVEIPDGLKYSIGDYDNTEYIKDTYIEVTEEELKNGLTNEKINLAKLAKSIKLV